MPSRNAANYVRLRGLPFNCTEEQIREFLSGLEVLEITFNPSSSGRPSGECYCEFKNADDVKEAKARDRQNIGSRYVEVFEVGDVEMEQVLRRAQVKNNTSNKGFVRIRGLPFNCKRDEVLEFFKGLNVEEVVFGKEPGFEGRPTGDGFVQFSTNAEADQAVQLNNQHLGNRYLEIFKIDGGAFEVYRERSQNSIVPLRNVEPSYDPWGYPTHGGGYPPRGGYPGYDAYGGAGGYGDYPYGGGYEAGYGKAPGNRRPMRGGVDRYNPYGAPGGGRGGYGGYHPPAYAIGGYEDPSYGGGFTGEASPCKVFIRGLPFRITAKEIENFFLPLVCVGVQLGVMPDGRSSGDGIVEFSNPQDAKQALAKDRQNIGSRYVEIFPSTQIRIPTNTRYELVGGRSGEIPPKPDAYYPDPTVAPNASGYDQWGQPLASSAIPAYPDTPYYGDKQKYSWA